jgi:hypothetical protein
MECNHGGGNIGPSVGESVLTHVGRGVVLALGKEEFLVRVRIGEVEREVLFDLSLYEREFDGKYVRCAWDCGYGHLEMHCFLAKSHTGPHLFKLSIR